MRIQRRSFLASIFAAAAAPVFVRAESLMPIYVPKIIVPNGKLQIFTLSVNAQNRRLPFSGKSTPLGVSFLKRDLPKRFTSAINVKGKKTFLGYFFTAEDAEVAYLNAKRKLHEGCTV